MIRFLVAGLLAAVTVASAAAETRAFYRLYNGVDHFYTSNCDERNRSMRRGGYDLEGTAGFVSDTQLRGTVPLYRLNNGNEHFYTTSDSERRKAVRRGGYVDEGIAGFISPNSVRGTTALHRGVNPDAGDHFYTLDKRELQRARDYTYEGVAGYVFTSGSSCRGG